MKQFREWLIEESMTIDKAKAILQLSGDFTEDDIKKAAKKMMQKYHPDKGGDADMFIQVKAAMEFLLSNPTVNKVSFDDLYVKIYNDIKENYNVNEFIKHFKSVFNEDFDVKVEDSKNNDRYVYLKYTYTNKKGDKIFEHVLSVDLFNVKYGKKSIGGGDDQLTYLVISKADAYANKKVITLSKRNYKFDTKKDNIFNPEKVFPKSKLIKAYEDSGKVSKRDVVNYIEKVLKLKKYGKDEWVYNFDDGSRVMFMRITYNREAVWQIMGYSKNSSNFDVIVTVEENKDIFDVFDKVVKDSHGKYENALQYLKSIKNK